MNQTFMKEKPVLSLVLAMSVPNVLSMLVNSMYNIVDSFFVAQINENAMTALSLVFPIQNLVTAIGVGFGVGINAIIALYLGGKNNYSANTSASQGVLLSLIHGIILTIVSMMIMPRFLRLFTSNDEVIAMGLKYSYVAFSFSISVSVGIVLEKIFQSVGRMKTTMFVMIAGCLTNIILDPILIFGLGPIPAMGIAGAAIATGIGQTLILILYIIIYIMKPTNVKLSVEFLKYKRGIIKQLYFIGIPATLNMALPSLLISVLNSILAMYSQIYVVVLGIYYKLQTFVYLPANGIIQGIRPLVGYNYGAKEYGRVKKIYRVSLMLSIVIMMIGTGLCMFIPEQLISLFSSNDQTIQAGVIALRIISIGFIISAVSISSSGLLEGLGMGLPSLGISLLRYVLLIIPIAFILSQVIGANGVWHAFWITELIVAGIAYLLYIRAFKN
ncbi:MATE family efflux transporter [Clostridium sp.]|uniref:MATE family efflux transporter n=1 Tax=Clostridium sp. TaxID=1506 RepID=UPI00261CD920|nr:MATE family efflux transporter [Clostridium sp.]